MTRFQTIFLELMLLAVGAASVWLLAWPRVVEARSDDLQAQCRKQLNLLATAQEICFARAGAYQSDVVQLEPASLARMSCPVSERPYVLRSDGVSYAVLCPPPESHGANHDGVVSWESAR